MARTLKTFVTSLGFFELAVAAPSMKAALEAWGAGSNLFQQGFAEQTEEAPIVAAAMAKPGVVLKRAVGTRGPFTENAELPEAWPAIAPRPRPPRPKSRPQKPFRSAEVISFADERATRRASASYEREREKHDRARQKQEVAEQQERERRDRAVKKVRAELEKAAFRHQKTLDDIEATRAALDDRKTAEDARWKREKHKLEESLRRARD